MNSEEIFIQLERKVAEKPDELIVIAIKGRYPFTTDLPGLDLSDCISVLLLNTFYKGKMPEHHLRHFDFVHHFDIGEFWLGGALSHLDSLDLPPLDEYFDNLITCLKTHDPKFNVERIRVVALEEQFVRLAAQIRQRLGIPGARPEDVERFTDKFQMKKVADEGGLPSSKYVVVTPLDLKNELEKKKLVNFIGYPIMFKPVHGVGTSGIEKINTPSELDAWLKSHTEPDMQYLAEEFMDGQEYHTLALVQKSSVQIFPVAHVVYGASILESIRHSVPLCMDTEKDPEKRSIAEKFIHHTLRVFKPHQGSTVFVQAFMTKSKEMVLSELAYRVPGMIGSVMFTQSTGISPESVQLMAQVRPLDFKQLASLGRKRNNFFANFVYPKKEGFVKRIDQLPKGSLKSDVDVIYVVKAGEKLRPPTNIGDMAARVFLWNDDADELKNDIDWLRENYRPVVMVGDE